MVMKNALTTTLMLASMVVFPGAAWANDQPAGPASALTLPARVRIQLASGRKMTCMMTGYDDRQVTLIGCGRDSQATSAIPLTTIDLMERSLGRRRGRGAGIGFLIGAALGAGLVLVQGDIPDTCNGGGCLTLAGLVAPVTGVLGASVGALSAPEAWHVVDRSSMGSSGFAAPPPAGGRIAVAWSIRF